MDEADADAELLTQWCAGDNHAGQELARRYFGMLRAYFINKAPLDHEDLVANTLLRLVQKRDSYRAQSSFRVFVFGIARMILLEHLRARQRDQRFDPMDSSVADFEGGRMSSIMAAREQHRLLFDALRQLELREQELLELYYWQKLSAGEIGELQGLIEATVRSRIRAALKRLAKAYTELDAQTHEREFTPELIEGWLSEVREELDHVSVQVA